MGPSPLAVPLTSDGIAESEAPSHIVVDLDPPEAKPWFRVYRV